MAKDTAQLNKQFFDSLKQELAIKKNEADVFPTKLVKSSKKVKLAHRTMQMQREKIEELKGKEPFTRKIGGIINLPINYHLLYLSHT